MPQYVSKTTYNKAVNQLNSLNTEISSAQSTLSQQNSQIQSLQNQIASLKQQEPHIVSYQNQYVKNCYSCLYLYNRYAVYSNGTKKQVSTVVKRLNACAGLPVTYVGLKYLFNSDGGKYYHYAVYAYMSNGSKKQIGTHVNDGPVQRFVCTV